MAGPPASKLILAGRLKGAHGVRGDVRVQSFTGDPADLFTYGPLFNKDGAVLLTPVSAREANDHFIVSPKEKHQKEHWDALRGTDVFVPRDRFAEAEDDEFYIDDLIGLRVLETGEEAIGEVIGVQNYGGGDLLEIRLDTETTSILVPFTDADVTDVDFERQIIRVPDLHLWRESKAEKPDPA